MEKIDDQKLLSSGLEKLMPVKTVLLLKSLSQTAFPQKSQQIQRQILFLISVWIITSDQFFESRRMSAATLRDFSSYITKRLRRGFKEEKHKTIFPAGAYWPHYLIKDIYETMNEAKINAQMFSLFKKSAGRFFRAMIKEKIFSLKNTPSFAVYIENGRKSIGSDIALYALGALVFAKSSLSAREYGIIEKTAYHSSIILRLANDLGSYERENKAGRINSLSILIKQGTPFLKAQREILKLIKEHRKFIIPYYKASNKQLRQYIEAISRILDFNIQLYIKQDYYDRRF